MTDVPPARLSGHGLDRERVDPGPHERRAEPGQEPQRAQRDRRRRDPQQRHQHRAAHQADDRHRHAPVAVDRVPGRPPEQDPRDPEARQQHAARDRVQAELVRRQHRDQEADAGDARVADERRRAQEPDPPREDRPQRRRRALARRGVHRRQQRQHGRHHGLGHERQPPVDRPQRTTAQRATARPPPSGPPRTSRPPARSGSAAPRPPAPRAAAASRTRSPSPAARARRGTTPRFGANAAATREQRVDDVARAHDPPAAEPLTERPGHELQQRERHEVGRDRQQPRRRSWRRTRRAAAGRARRPRRRRTARGSRRCRREASHARAQRFTLARHVPAQGQRSPRAQVDARPSLDAAPEALQEGRPRLPRPPGHRRRRRPRHLRGDLPRHRRVLPLDLPRAAAVQRRRAGDRALDRDHRRPRRPDQPRGLQAALDRVRQVAATSRSSIPSSATSTAGSGSTSWPRRCQAAPSSRRATGEDWMIDVVVCP